MEQCQAVDNAGLSGTIRPEDERYRLYRYRLRFRKRFEVAKMKGVNHSVSPKMPMPLSAVPFPAAVLSYLPRARMR